ncbi:MAG: DUF5684 domain-containing protein [Bacteroidetes bacterium]|nr:DUF5684 domain-containing protein [Bacteroidota bacterium]
MTKIVGKPGYWVLLMLIPFIGLIWSVWTYNMLSKSFGKTESFTLGLVLLNFIFWPIFGLRRCKVYRPLWVWWR